MKRTRARTITAAALRAWPLPDPSGSDSKEDRGRVLVVGGSREIPGAALLAGTAALHAGAGKLQLATAQDAALPIAIALPEARVIGLPSGRRGAITQVDRATRDCIALADAVLVGPGMDSGAATRRIVRAVISGARCPVVLDAGALHVDAMGAYGKRSDGQGLVLTPHVGEMASLLEMDAAAVQAGAPALALRCAAQWNAVVVLKGPTTHIASPDGVLWVNTAGSVGLGTSGSGDVLAGIVAGLAARGAPAAQAACWGVFLHAKAGETLTRRMGLVGFLARQISAEVPSLLDL